LSDVTLRPADEHDVRAFWEWRNDKAARAASFTPEPLPFEHHERWFRGRLADPDTLLYVILDPEGASVGYVRFSLEGRDAEISIALAPTTRGLGYGTAAIRRGCELVFATGRVSRVVARVKADNEASRRAFGRAGFGGPSLALAVAA
jgi:UDP-2,4-diacetamido-2,4,6-trideoxy-beta-L-altropyranose hydrolase